LFVVAIAVVVPKGRLMLCCTALKNGVFFARKEEEVKLRFMKLGIERSGADFKLL
jgi:hypothetical protein